MCGQQGEIPMKKWFTVVAALALAGTAHADDPLDAAAIAQAKVQAKDAKQVGDLYRGSTEKTDFQILLEGNTCYWFSGVSEGAPKLYMYLWTTNASTIRCSSTPVSVTGCSRAASPITSSRSRCTCGVRTTSASPRPRATTPIR